MEKFYIKINKIRTYPYYFVITVFELKKKVGKSKLPAISLCNCNFQQRERMMCLFPHCL